SARTSSLPSRTGPSVIRSNLSWRKAWKTGPRNSPRRRTPACWRLRVPRAPRRSGRRDGAAAAAAAGGGSGSATAAATPTCTTPPAEELESPDDDSAPEPGPSRTFGRGRRPEVESFGEFDDLELEEIGEFDRPALEDDEFGLEESPAVVEEEIDADLEQEIRRE